jgi:hypothetical protein
MVFISSEVVRLLPELLLQTRVFELDGKQNIKQLAPQVRMVPLCSIGFELPKKNKQVQLIIFTCNGNGPFLHRFEQSGLCFWWRSVDFIRQNNIRKTGPL